MPLVFKPKYDKGLILVFVAVPLLPLGRAVSLVVQEETQLAWFMLGVTGFAVVALWSLLPRAIELWPDRIRIVLGWPWRKSILLSGIKEVRPVKGLAPWIGLGAMFATSFRTPVQIKRTTGMSILLSPEDPKRFTEAVGDALPAD